MNQQALSAAVTGGKSFCVLDDDLPRIAYIAVVRGGDPKHSCTRLL